GFRRPGARRWGGGLGGALNCPRPFGGRRLARGRISGAYRAASGNYRRVLFRRGDGRGVWPMIRHYFLFGPKPPQIETYNPLQKLAYTAALALGALLAATGLALYKPVQLAALITLFGGLRATRVWHFAAMSGLAALIPGHLIMAALHGWSTFASMWTGSPRGARAPQ